ncbi:MAG: type 1 glutamine amidotransferase [Thaumarchaeota archaeon]|nr:type 1 glutamine amidotransferase [Nitrososphaerota archaeon]
MEWEHAGIVGSYLKDKNARSDVVRLYKNDAIPLDSLEERAYTAVVALGSPATAYSPETNRHHDEEIEFFRLIRRLHLPSFNTCYSMQMFCVANGGVVGPNPAGKEVGFFDVRLTAEGERDPIIGSVGDFRTLQWHGDSVLKLPSGASHLARSQKTKHQVAVVDGLHYLFQGDGQAATTSMVKRWFRKDGVWALQGSGARKKLVIQEVRQRRTYFSSVYRRIFEDFLRNTTGNASQSK